MEDSLIITVVVIALAVFAGQWIARKLQQSATKGPTEVVKSLYMSVEDFLDAYPNV